MTLIYPLLHELISLKGSQVDAVDLRQPSVFLLHFIERTIYHDPFFLLHCHVMSGKCPIIQTIDTLLRLSPRPHREGHKASKKPRISTSECLLNPL